VGGIATPPKNGSVMPSGRLQGNGGEVLRRRGYMLSQQWFGIQTKDNNIFANVVSPNLFQLPIEKNIFLSHIIYSLLDTEQTSSSSVTLNNALSSGSIWLKS
jgi:hypothetical protein